MSTPKRAYRGVSAEQRSEERRQRLLEAALALFASQGYAKTPIETLCAAAGVTARHFYQHFPSREALLRALYDDIVEDLRLAVLAAVSQPDIPRHEQISLAVQALVMHYLEDSRRARVGVLEVVGVSAAMEQRRRAVIHEMAHIIEQYIQGLASRGELPEHNYHLVSVALVGGINELMAEWLTVAQSPTVTELSNEIIYIFDALLRGAALAKFTGS